MFGSNTAPRNVMAGGRSMSPTKKYRICKAGSSEKAFRKKIDFSPLKKILNNGCQLVKTSSVILIPGIT
jgi:hypothetical protein